MLVVEISRLFKRHVYSTVLRSCWPNLKLKIFTPFYRTRLKSPVYASNRLSLPLSTILKSLLKEGTTYNHLQPPRNIQQPPTTTSKTSTTTHKQSNTILNKPSKTSEMTICHADIARNRGHFAPVFIGQRSMLYCSGIKTKWRRGLRRLIKGETSSIQNTE